MLLRSPRGAKDGLLRMATTATKRLDFVCDERARDQSSHEDDEYLGGMQDTWVTTPRSTASISLMRPARLET